MKIEETVDRESQDKLYVQIYNIIKGKIEKGDWSADSLIPSEDELCRIFEVSKATLRSAISELVRDGYLKRQQGKGTFVTYSIPHVGILMRTVLMDNIFGEEVGVKKELLEKGVKEPSEDVKEYLAAKDGIYCILCKGVVEGEPAYLEKSFIPLSLFPGIEKADVCNNSFYDLIQEKGMRKIFKVVQTVEVTKIKEDAAHILKVREGSPVLLLRRILLSSNGSPIAYMKFFVGEKKFKVQMEFEKLR